MHLSSEQKKDLFSQYSIQKTGTDTGSAESQIALFTVRINHLTEHLKGHKKDHATRLSLMKLVGKRRSLLDYLTRKDITRYRSIIAELGLRK